MKKMRKDMTNKIFNELLKDYKKDESRDDKILVGFMKLDNGEYATVTIKKFEAYETPHMHIDAGDVHVAVRMDKPKYYIHDQYKGKLHDSEMKAFMDMLNDNYKGARLSNWEYASMEFNHSFESVRLNDMPKYEILNSRA